MSTRAVFALALVLAGCAAPKQWFHASNTEQQFYADRVGCMQTAQGLHPTNNVAIGQQQTTGTAQCTAYGRVVNCAGQQATTQPIVLDANASARGGEFDMCMRSRGYFLR